MRTIALLCVSLLLGVSHAGIARKPEERQLPLICAVVSCLYPTCADGATPVVPEGGCCPVCPTSMLTARQTCDDVMCPMFVPFCMDGSAPQIPDGDCCPTCPGFGLIVPLEG